MIALCVLVLALGLSGCGGDAVPEGDSVPGPVAEKEPPPEDDRPDPVEITLFFPGSSGLLYGEPRTVLMPVDVDAQATTVLREYLAGPRSEALARPFDESVRLGGVYLTLSGAEDVEVSTAVGSDSSVAIVDLVSTDAPNPPASGSREERQRVYGVVHSLVDNIPSVTGVVLLWNGRQRSAFAGHVDTGHVLRRDQSLIAVVP